MRFGLLKPTTKVSRPFGSPLAVFRCDTDGGLVTLSQASLMCHAGHRVRDPIIINIFELALIWLRLVK